MRQRLRPRGVAGHGWRRVSACAGSVGLLQSVYKTHTCELLRCSGLIGAYILRGAAAIPYCRLPSSPSWTGAAARCCTCPTRRPHTPSRRRCRWPCSASPMRCCWPRTCWPPPARPPARRRLRRRRRRRGRVWLASRRRCWVRSWAAAWRCCRYIPPVRMSPQVHS